MEMCHTAGLQIGVVNGRQRESQGVSTHLQSIQVSPHGRNDYSIPWLLIWSSGLLFSFVARVELLRVSAVLLYHDMLHVCVIFYFELYFCLLFLCFAVGST